MQICNFFGDSKSRAQELSNDVSFVIFGHKTWDLEGGGQIDPPPNISWFSSTPARIGLMKIHRNIYSLEFAFDLSKQSIILKIIVFHEIVYVSLKASQSDL